MQATPWLAHVTWLVALALLGCDHAGARELDASSSQGEPPDAGAVGDWFVCADEPCLTLQPTGLRLTAEHRVHHLMAASEPDASAEPFRSGDAYCVTESFGSYTLNGEVLTLSFHDGALVVDTLLELGEGGVTAHDGAMRKVVPNATGLLVDGECLEP